MSLSVLFNEQAFPVKMPPQTTLKAICQAACAHFKLEADQFELHHKDKRVDEGLSLRFAAFPHGTKLHLKPISANARATLATGNQQIKLCLQLPNGERLLDTLPAQTTLWAVLQHFETKNALNLTNLYDVPPVESSQGMQIEYFVKGYMQPTILALNQTFSETPQLQQCKLSELVSSGTLLLKLSHRYIPPPPDPNALNKFHEKMASVSAMLASGQVRTSSSSSSSTDDEEILPAAPLAPLPEAPESLPVNRHRRVFLAPATGPVNLKMFDVPEEFYDITHEDYHTYVRSVKTKDPRETEFGTKTKKHFPVVKIRVRFPDRFYVEGSFFNHEKMSDLVAFVQSCLQNPDLPFQLFVAPPRTVLSDLLDSSFSQLNLVPAAIVNFSSSVTSSSDLLNEEVRKLAIELPPNELTKEEMALRQKSLSQESSSTAATFDDKTGAPCTRTR